MYTNSATIDPETTRLIEEIEILEQRLRCMGGDGDCAYERAMSTLYRSIVEERKAQLRRLMAATAG